MPGLAPQPRFRRAADLAAIRLGRSVLAYLACVIIVITLSPFQFAAAPVHGLSTEWDWPDIIMNVVMFMPIGFLFQLTRPAGTIVRWAPLALMGLALSAAIETAQLFEATRFTSLIDVATNTAGAVVGAALFNIVRTRVEAPGSVRAMALEMPLMGLVYLLVPLIWLTGLASEAGSRAWLTLPVIAFGAGILGAVHAAIASPANRTRTALAAAAIGWSAIALLPAALQQPVIMLAGAAIALGVSWTLSIATSRHRESGARRFEIPTLRLLLPLFAAFLALSSVWPLQAVDGMWRINRAFAPVATFGTASVFLVLEHIAAFTLVGYIVAEFHGRQQRSDRSVIWRVLAWSSLLSLLLEGARGLHPAHGASPLMLVLTVAAAAFGGWLYQLQRDLIVALLSRRNALPTSTDRGGREP